MGTKIQQGEPETVLCRYAQEGHRNRVNSGAEITNAGQVQTASHGERKLDMMMMMMIMMMMMTYGIVNRVCN